MERDGTWQLSTIYTYGNQRINSESYNNLSGSYTYDGRGSVSAVIGGYGDFRASYWYDGLGNVVRNLYGAGDSNNRYKPYYGYNAESYNPVTGNQNLRARQLNIRRQRFLTEDTYLGNKTDTLSINRYIYGNNNPLKYKDPSGFISNVVMSSVSLSRTSSGCGGDDSYIKYGFSSLESWEYWDTIATNAVNAEIVKRGITGQVTNEQEAVIAGEILRDILNREQRFNTSIIGGLNPPTSNEILIAQAIHYTRNKYNNYNGGDFPNHIDIFKIGEVDEEDIYTWNDNVAAIYHQHSRLDSGENIKLVDITGKMEVVYNAEGNIVLDPRDIGTYNFSSSNDAINHYLLDMGTYYRWGNAPNDSTSAIGRLIGIVD